MNKFHLNKSCRLFIVKHINDTSCGVSKLVLNSNFENLRASVAHLMNNFALIELQALTLISYTEQ